MWTSLGQVLTSLGGQHFQATSGPGSEGGLLPSPSRSEENRTRVQEKAHCVASVSSGRCSWNVESGENTFTLVISVGEVGKRLWHRA